MNKQMTPAEIELVQESLGGLAPVSDDAAFLALARVEAGPLPTTLNIPAAIALVNMTMK